MGRIRKVLSMWGYVEEPYMSNTGIKYISWDISDGKTRIQISYKGQYKALYAKEDSFEENEEMFEEAKKILREFKNNK